MTHTGFIMAATNSIIKLLIICLTIITITVILTYKSSILITHTSKDNKMRYLSIRNVTSGRDEKNDTTEKLEDPVPTEKFHEDVKPHVAKAISKMYHELKANGTIINDLISTKEPIIPNIYHFIRFNRPEVQFFEMLGIISALKIGKADKVYIHTNSPLTGMYWDEIKTNKKIVLVDREPNATIYGKPYGWIQHAADLARIQILREYGGIYLDNDCFVINKIEGLRKHHCVVSKSSYERWFGNMVMMGTSDCVFFRLYEELYKLDYQNGLWYFNGGILPQYALLDQYPGIAVMADEGVHFGLMFWLYSSNRSVADTRSRWNFLHVLYRHKKAVNKDTIDYNHTSIRTIQNTFANIARWIYYDHEEPFAE